MTLSFSTKWPKTMPPHLAGKPNYFVEKLSHSIKEAYGDHLPAYYQPDEYDFVQEINAHPKIHTIRKDEKDKWKPGMGIHFVINNRTKDRFQFAPVIPVVSVQEIKIVYDPDFCEQYSTEPTVLVDGNPLRLDEMELLAKNDGFNDAYEFCHWFKEDFTGKIIHWTNFKY